MAVEYEKLIVLMEASVGKFDKDIANIAKTVDTAMRKIEASTTQTTAKVDTALGQLSASMTRYLAPAAIVGAVTAFTTVVLKNVTALDDQAQAAGVTVEQLQAYRAAAAEAGAATEIADTALQRLTRSIGQAKDGNKQLMQAFSDLGIASFQLTNTVDVMPLIAQGLSRIGDTATRARIETELFGKSGQQIESVITAWGTAADELVAHFSKLGVVIDANTAEKFGKAQGAWELFELRMQKGLVDIIAGLGDLAAAEGRSKLLSGGLAAGQEAIGNVLGQPKFKSFGGTSNERLGEIIPELNLIRPGLEKAPDINVAFGPDIDDAKRRADELEKIEREFRNKEKARRTQAVVDQVDLDKESIEASFKYEETVRKQHEDTLGEMSEGDKKYFDERQRLEEDAQRRQEQYMRAIAAEFASFGDIMDEAGGKFGKAVELMILDLAKLMLKMEATKALSSALHDIDTASGGAGFFGSVMKLIGLRAEGGPVSSGSPYVVGEQGPELFVPRVAGTIIPNNASAPASSGNMNLNVVVNGARGNSEIRDMVAVGVQQGIAVYDRQALPARVARLNADPRAR